MNDLLLFTDGSVDTRSGVGIGARLVVSDPRLPLSAHQGNVQVLKFDSTSSTKLELQTLLWALNEVSGLGRKVIVHTDSQNILSLLGRRERLEGNDFRSKAGRPLNHFELYREFYRMLDQLDCEFVKVRGHQPSKNKDEIDELFTLVDRASRDALRENLSG